MTSETYHNDTDNLYSRKVIWCPICSSTEIRALIVSKAKTSGVNIYEVCKFLGIRYGVFKKYWLKAASPGSVRGCRATEIRKIGEVLGIKMRIVVANGMMDVDKIKPFIRKEKGKRKYVTIDKRQGQEKKFVVKEK